MKLKSLNELSRHTKPYSKEIIDAFSKLLDDGWYVLGPEVKKFEDSFAKYNGVSHCLSLANGTDALEIAIKSLDLSEYAGILTVANAGMYSSSAILAANKIPVYVDVDPDSQLMNFSKAEELISSQKIEAVIVTHLYGLLPPNLAKFVSFAKSKGVAVIEDCAQAHGAVIDKKKAGSFGDIGCFSFYPTKNLGALGDGGALITNSKELYNKAAKFRQYGWGSKYQSEISGGRNSRLDEIQAAVLNIFLPKLDGWNDMRRKIASEYTSGIKNKNIILPPLYGVNYVAHLYVIRTLYRTQLINYLKDNQIPFDIHYPVPDHLQNALSYLKSSSVNLPETEKLSNQVLTLPCFPEMSDEEIGKIISVLNNWSI